MGLVEQRKSKRRDIMMQVDLNKEIIYNACKEKALTGQDIVQMFGFTFHQAKSYLEQLLEDNHLEKNKIYHKKRRCWLALYKSTNLVYKPRTAAQVEEYLIKVYGGRTTQSFGEGKFDDLIANNPNLRKVKLFDEKDHDYFKQPMKKTGKTSIGSTWSLYDSASGFDS